MAAAPYDEPNIQCEDVIIRRVNPAQHVVFDENTGKMRTSSKLFSPSSEPNGGMSVDFLNLIEKAKLDAREFVITPVFTGAVCFSACSARSVALRIGYDPIEAALGVKENPFHGEVWGAEATPNKFASSQKRALATASAWFVEIANVEIGR